MSSSKGDSRYEAHTDFDNVDPYSESSDEDTIEPHVRLNRLNRQDRCIRSRGSGPQQNQWVEDNFDALEELFKCFKTDGQALFGGAFYQLGDMNKFVHFVFASTVPN